MLPSFSVFVGTLGTGLWRSRDTGGHWEPVRQGLGPESRIFCLACDPSNPDTIYAGAADGLWQSLDRGANFHHVESPMNALEVWRIGVDPANSRTLYAGTRPAALFRSLDGGVRWTRLSAKFPATCPAVRVPRVTALTVDPTDSRVVWAGIEVDGVQLSIDGGETWRRVGPASGELDIHDIIVTNRGQVFVSTPGEVFSTDAEAKLWRPLLVQPHFRYPYCRGLGLKTDDAEVLFVGTGEAAVGATGAIQRSADGGVTWTRPELPSEPNSPAWAFATHKCDPDLVVCCSHYGQLFISRDAGLSWAKVRREFTQTRSLMLLVNPLEEDS